MTDPATPIAPGEAGSGDRAALLAALTALVVALDERVPHVERAGEHQIALEAAALRAEAMARLQALTRPSAGEERGDPAP